MFFPCSVV
ncbi:hypothetical protein F383_39431 [Gossypium arboreum]|uniref:Uncharacterized protein n=1 Tax=Gossypium arboreum TaxID=29729 RepID=A0A0B0MU57_GOSAR|nr:hypothetical protein F383_39431 [Gossypium arboreum]